jgi:ADP-ribose pyrophosphatase
MRFSSQLPTPPNVELEIVEERKAPATSFLRSVVRVCRTRDDEGKMSREFVYEEVDRASLDAVVIVPHLLRRIEGRDERWVVLRSALRPPVVLRKKQRSPILAPEGHSLWEVPAGLVEESDGQQEDIRQAAARELLEEAGFEVSCDQLIPLGPPSFPSPGVIAERHFFFHVEVNLEAQVAPLLDGSPLEEAGELVALPLRKALEAAADGRLADAKTELALRRIAECFEGQRT